MTRFVEEFRRDAVAGDVEEAMLAASRFDLAGDSGQTSGRGVGLCSGQQRSHVYHREGV